MFLLFQRGFLSNKQGKRTNFRLCGPNYKLPRATFDPRAVCCALNERMWNGRERNNFFIEIVEDERMTLVFSTSTTMETYWKEDHFRINWLFHVIGKVPVILSLVSLFLSLPLTSVSLTHTHVSLFLSLSLLSLTYTHTHIHTHTLPYILRPLFIHFRFRCFCYCITIKKPFSQKLHWKMNSRILQRTIWEICRIPFYQISAENIAKSILFPLFLLFNSLKSRFY